MSFVPLALNPTLDYQAVKGSKINSESMENQFDDDPEGDATMRKLFPTFPDEVRREVKELLNGYAEICLRIFTRMEEERKNLDKSEEKM